MSVSVDTNGESGLRDDDNSTTVHPIVVEDGEMMTNPRAMYVGFPYGAIFEGVPVVGIKRRDGSVDFFYVNGA